MDVTIILFKAAPFRRIVPKTTARKNQFVVRKGLPPSAQVLHFSPDGWELFIEAACVLRPLSGDGGKYQFVKKMGGAGDGGRDIEARFTTDLLPQKWDLYQAKHYGSGLTPSEMFPEFAKFFLHLKAKTYPPPRFYYLCAPKGVGNDLHDLLAKPAEFKKRFIEAWANGKTGLKGRTAELSSDLLELIQNFDFSTIKECQLRDLLEWHSLDRKSHFELFGVEAERGDDPGAPALPSAREHVYVEELIRVYAEHTGRSFSVEELMSSGFSEHFHDQRALFYCAEGLKIFSRDLYGEEEFYRLLEMVLTGVRPCINSVKHSNGLDRLESAIDKVSVLKVNDSTLAPRLRPGDLPGSCHHLVNLKKIKWVK
jgi:hypothetical protein